MVHKEKIKTTVTEQVTMVTSINTLPDYERVEKCHYLGSVIEKDCEPTDEMQQRIAIAKPDLSKLAVIWKVVM